MHGLCPLQATTQHVTCVKFETRLGFSFLCGMRKDTSRVLTPFSKRPKRWKYKWHLKKVSQKGAYHEHGVAHERRDVGGRGNLLVFRQPVGKVTGYLNVLKPQIHRITVLHTEAVVSRIHAAWPTACNTHMGTGRTTELSKGRHPQKHTDQRWCGGYGAHNANNQHKRQEGASQSIR